MHFYSILILDPLLVFAFKFPLHVVAEVDPPIVEIVKQSDKSAVEILESGNGDHFHTAKYPKLKIRKRASRKNLGDRCSTYSDCPLLSPCMSNICSCPYDHYIYMPQFQPDVRTCRKKVKYGSFCTLTDDCLGHDSNSVCIDSVCKCVNGTHYIGSRNLLPHQKRCYKILESKGDVCEIDEQCSRLADNYHKCRCVGRCDCTSVNRYGGCSICHENIKRTFFGGAAFIVLLLSSRVFSKMKRRTNSRQQQNEGSGGFRSPCCRLNTSRTIPLSTVSRSRSNLHSNRRITASLPNVYLIESHGLLGIRSSNTTDFNTQESRLLPESSDRNEDAPPAYEDIVGNSSLIWNDPPPAYNEVAPKNSRI